CPTAATPRRNRRRIRAPYPGPLVDLSLQLRNTPELIKRRYVIDLEQFALLERLHVLHGHIDAVDVAQNAAAQFLNVLGEGLDFVDRRMKQPVELFSKRHVIRSDCGQNARMIERSPKGLL